MKHLTAIIIGVQLLSCTTKAFTAKPVVVQNSRSGPSAKTTTTRLHYDDEKTVVPLVETKEILSPNEDIGLSEKAFKQLTKTRPYPLFVTEKVVGTMERTAHGIGQLAKRVGAATAVDVDDETAATISSMAAPKKAKEKVVCLGVGWGSAALLADIDTDIYDVTVISPRNHFVFTPSKYTFYCHISPPSDEVLARKKG